MIIPLGPEGKRRLVPVVTIALIAINVVVHVLTLGRVEDDEKALQHSAERVMSLQMEIMEKHDASAVYPLDDLVKAAMTGHPDPIPGGFWGRYERGDVVPSSDPEWHSWQDAKLELRQSLTGSLHTEFGFAAAKPNALGLFTSAFLHAGWMHLIGNMAFLWCVGALLEETWGSRLFALTYLVGILVSPWGGIFGPDSGRLAGIGASGAVATVMGAFAVRHFTERIRVFTWFFVPKIYSVRAGWWLLFWLGWQIIDNGVVLKASAQGGTAFAVHVTGFLAGVACAYAYRLAGVEQKVMPVQEKLKAQAAKNDHVKLADELLARRDAKGGLEQLQLAVAAQPDDPALRLRLYELLQRTGDHAAARQVAADLLPILWRSSDKAAFAGFFTRAESEVGVEWPAQWTFRCAFTLEPGQPHEAARLHGRVIQQSPGDPHAKQSLERYAKLLERFGDRDRAAQARAMLPHLEAAAQRTPPPH